MNRQLQWLCCAAALVTLIGALSPSMAKKSSKPKMTGKQLFEQHCASCHGVSGENKVSPSHPVAGSQKLANLGIFKEYLSNPPGHMPYYEDLVHNEASLKAIYNYCKGLKPPLNQASL